MKTLLFFSDPGHGWLAVEKDYLQALGIADKISTCSYQKGNLAYLEEDCDAALLIDAMKAKNIEFVIQEIYQENTPIRNYHSYNSTQ